MDSYTKQVSIMYLNLPNIVEKYLVKQTVIYTVGIEQLLKA